MIPHHKVIAHYFVFKATLPLLQICPFYPVLNLTIPPLQYKRPDPPPHQEREGVPGRETMYVEEMERLLPLLAPPERPLLLPAPLDRLLPFRDPGSNRGPLDLQSNALPTELSRPHDSGVAVFKNHYRGAELAK